MARTPEEKRGIRTEILRRMGGKCQRCGYDQHPAALHLHHMDPASKDPRFHGLLSWEWEDIEAELEKCELLCSNCHVAHHQLHPSTCHRAKPEKRPASKLPRKYQNIIDTNEFLTRRIEELTNEVARIQKEKSLVVIKCITIDTQDPQIPRLKESIRHLKHELQLWKDDWSAKVEQLKLQHAVEMELLRRELTQPHHSNI